MRILHVLGDLAPETGGPAKAGFEMARAVARRGHEVRLTATDYAPGGRLDVPLDRPVRQDGVEIRFFPVQAPRRWLASWPMRRALADLVPWADVVHLHSLYLFHDWAAGSLCIRNGVPYIVRPHGTLDPVIHRRRRLRKTMIDLWFQDRVLAHAAAIHYTSAEEMRLAQPHARGAPGVVVPLGLDLADYAELPPRGAFRARHPEIGTRPIVLFLGRLNFKKGLNLLVPAFARLLAGGSDAHLVIAGPDGGMLAKLEGWIGAAGLGQRTTLTGMLTGRDKLAALADADLFVLPSWSENFGIAVVEAMACELPVLVSDRVNIWREVAADGGGRIEPPDVARFAAAMAELLADPARLAAMGKMAKTSVARRWSWEGVAVELESLYTRLAASRPASRLASAAG